tara:strand:+ start:72 stop:359 length:288 start_codon:yes stop_codon:yes gene_type:complete
MAYVQMPNKGGWPDGYEEVEYLARGLKYCAPAYSVYVERKMFAMHGGVEYRVTIVRWEGSNRIEIATYEDISEATGALRLLIGNAQAERSLNMYS